ncbi:MAG: glycosyltransferase family 2 protein [Deltaproteobacteria bacterium]|nr:glycosyltransferase family 2 protein [Deltaproteobacteria bacterium]
MINTARCDFSFSPALPESPGFEYLPALLGNPAVSIITPYFNTDELFLETMLTGLRQSFQQFEWIIVDDGTDDAESLERLRFLSIVDERISVHRHEQNRGLSAARNTGFSLARCDWVFQLDSDDLLEPTAIEKLLWTGTLLPDAAAVGSFHVGFYANEYLNDGGFHHREGFLIANQTDANVLVRKSVHHQVGGYDESNRGGLEDWDFWLKVAHAGHWGFTVPEHLKWYRWRPRESGSPWTNWDGGENQRRFLEGLRHRYPRLWTDGFPPPPQFMAPPCTVALQNPLRKLRRRELILCERIPEDIELLRSNAEGAEFTVVALEGDPTGAESDLTRVTPDLFVLNRFLPEHAAPMFLVYLVGSRQPDLIDVRSPTLVPMGEFLAKRSGIELRVTTE